MSRNMRRYMVRLFIFSRILETGKIWDYSAKNGILQIRTEYIPSLPIPFLYVSVNTKMNGINIEIRTRGTEFFLRFHPHGRAHATFGRRQSSGVRSSGAKRARACARAAAARRGSSSSVPTPAGRASGGRRAWARGTTTSPSLSP